jgi:hypothetical protein
MFNNQADVDAFEAAMAAKMRAEAKLIASKASLFELGGWGLALTGAGLCILLGCLGVVAFNGSNAKTQQAERAFIERVAATPLKVEVVLASGAQVTLAKGGMVGVSPDATLRLAPDSTVRAVADAPRPTPAQIIQADARPVKIDVDQFNTVSYGKGEVETGWEFSDANRQVPSTQWCNYREAAPDGTLRLLTIGKDGQRVSPPTPSPFPSIDLHSAFASCVWWSASRTPAAAKAPADRPDNQAAPLPSPRVISARAKG